MIRAVIIAGGRSVSLNESQRNALTRLLARFPEAVVMSGGAKGADTDGIALASGLGLETRVEVADWETYGRSAGARRNAVLVNLAKEAGRAVLIAFPGGKGTEDMVVKCRRAGFMILRVDEDGNVSEPGIRGLAYQFQEQFDKAFDDIMEGDANEAVPPSMEASASLSSDPAGVVVYKHVSDDAENAPVAISCNCPRPGYGKETHCLAERYGFHHTSDDWCNCKCHLPSTRGPG